MPRRVKGLDALRLAVRPAPCQVVGCPRLWAGKETARGLDCPQLGATHPRQNFGAQNNCDTKTPTKLADSQANTSNLSAGRDTYQAERAGKEGRRGSGS